MMQSPPSPRGAQPPRVTFHHEDPVVDKAEFQYETTSRREHAEIMAAVAQREKDELVSSSINAQVALRGATETLTAKQKLLADAQRDLAQLAAERTRQLGNLAASRAQVEDDIQRNRSLRDELEVQNATLQEKNASARLDYQQAHQRLDDAQRRVNDLLGQQKQLLSGVESASSEQVACAAANKVQMTRLNEIIAQTEAHIESATGKIQHVEKAIAVHDQEHTTYVDKQRSFAHEQKTKMQEEAKLVGLARSRLEAMESESEEAARRRRKDAEEQQRQEIADRKALLQELVAEREEAARKFRAATYNECEKVRSDVEAEGKSLTILREEAADVFDRELHLHEEIRRAKNDLIGFDALKQRNDVADDQSVLWKNRNDALSSDIKMKVDLVNDRSSFIESLRIQVAPLPDVEASIAAHAAKATAYQKARADLEAERAMAASRFAEREEENKRRVERIHLDLKDAQSEAQRQRDDVAARKESLESDLRIMASELKAADQKQKDMEEKNIRLDQTLEHIARQRRAMAEELAHRRDAARVAAQTLLAQLE